MSTEAGSSLAVRAREAFSVGAYRESAALYAKALEQDPQSAVLYCEIAEVCCVLGDLDGALGLFQQALHYDPLSVRALRCGSAILFWKGRLEDALAHARRLWALEGASAWLSDWIKRMNAAVGGNTKPPAHPENAASTDSSQGANSALRLPGPDPARWGDPGCGEWVRSGVQARIRGDMGGACEAFRRAIECNPVDPAPYLQLGMTLSLLGRSAPAALCLGTAVRLDPGNAEAHSRWGLELLRLDQTDQGMAALKTSLDLAPDSAVTLGFLGMGLLQTGRQHEAAAALERAVALQPSNPQIYSQWLAALHYIPTEDRAARHAAFQGYSARFEEPVLRRPKPLATGWESRLREGRRVRVGYVSGDFRNHSVAFFVEPLLRHHDRGRFEIFAYMTRRDSDAVTERLRGMAEHWRMVAALGYEAFAEAVRADKIDVLVDLSNHTAENRLLAFAYKPSPVQVTMIGLMQTTGLRSIDYRITDALLDPPGESDRFYSEKLFRLESGPLVFCPPSGAPEPNGLPAASGEGLVLACTNDLEKVTPGVRALWARVLHALPGARLLFFGRPGNRFGLEMGRLGIGPERLLEQGRQPLTGFLQTHHRIDLALDPFPYNGLTVTLLSAWMGVPCVTLEGKSPPERAAGSVLRRLGLPECVVQTEDQYVAAVAAWAADLPRLAGVRATLRERVRETLCDAARHVAELEAAYLEMLSCTGFGPKEGG